MANGKILLRTTTVHSTDFSDPRASTLTRLAVRGPLSSPRRYAALRAVARTSPRSANPSQPYAPLQAARESAAQVVSNAEPATYAALRPGR